MPKAFTHYYRRGEEDAKFSSNVGNYDFGKESVGFTRKRIRRRGFGVFRYLLNLCNKSIEFLAFGSEKAVKTLAKFQCSRFRPCSMFINKFDGFIPDEIFL